MLEKELEEAKSSVKEKDRLYKDCVKKVSALEKSIKEHDNNREGRLKELEKKIKTTKTQMQSSMKELKVDFNFLEICYIGSVRYLCRGPMVH